MQLNHHLKALGGTAEVLEDEAEVFPADSVKGLGEVYNIAYSPLFCSRHFSCNCRRMNTMSVVPLFALEAALAFGEIFFGSGWYEPLEQDPGKHFSGDG